MLCTGDYSTYHTTPPIKNYLFIWACDVFAENYNWAKDKEISLKETARKSKIMYFRCRVLLISTKKGSNPLGTRRG